MNDPIIGAPGADNVTDFSDYPRGPQDAGSGWLTAILLAAAFFVAIAPTLMWLEFSSRMENLVTATALETTRSGNWLQVFVREATHE